MRCDPTQGEHGYCLACLERTVLFEHECFACPLATIAINGLIQEEELEEEERDQRLRQIERECGHCTVKPPNKGHFGTSDFFVRRLSCSSRS